MSVGILAMAIGGVIGQEASGQLVLPVRSIVDHLVPLAVFDNGDWIGRAITLRGLDAALHAVRPESHRRTLIPELYREIIDDNIWVFAYVRDGVVASWLTMTPSGPEAGLEPSELAFWQLADGQLVLYPSTKMMRLEPQIRGAWLWWLYAVFDAVPARRHIANLMMPVLLRPRTLKAVARSFGTVHWTSSLAGAVQIINRLQHRAISMPYVWRVTQYPGSVHLRREHGFEYILKPDPQTALWSATPLHAPQDIIVQREDLLQLLLDADFLLEEQNFEDWLEARMVNGKLLYNPEPYELLDEAEPPMMKFMDFAGWTEGRQL